MSEHISLLDRRQFLRYGVNATATRPAIAQFNQQKTGRDKRIVSGATAEKLLASKYLLKAYNEAAAELLLYDNQTAAGKSDEAKSTLSKAAIIICDGLSQLSNDGQFWATLAEVRQTIADNASE